MKIPCLTKTENILNPLTAIKIDVTAVNTNGLNKEESILLMEVLGKTILSFAKSWTSTQQNVISQDETMAIILTPFYHFGHI